MFAWTVHGFGEGSINPVIHSLHDLKELPEAMALIANRQIYGKVVFKVV